MWVQRQLHDRSWSRPTAARSPKANDVRAPKANRELRRIAVQSTFSEAAPADASDKPQVPVDAHAGFIPSLMGPSSRALARRGPPQ